MGIIPTCHVFLWHSRSYCRCFTLQKNRAPPKYWKRQVLLVKFITNQHNIEPLAITLHITGFGLKHLCFSILDAHYLHLIASSHHVQPRKLTYDPTYPSCSPTCCPDFLHPIHPSSGCASKPNKTSGHERNDVGVTIINPHVLHANIHISLDLTTAQRIHLLDL